MINSISIKLTVAQIRDLDYHTAHLDDDAEVVVASALSLHALNLPDGMYAKIDGEGDLYGPLGRDWK